MRVKDLMSEHVVTVAPAESGLDPDRRVDELLGSVRVAELMSTDVLTVEPGADLADASAIMHDERVGSLPVVDHGRLVGVLTETDRLRHLLGARSVSDPECAEIIVSFP